MDETIRLVQNRIINMYPSREIEFIDEQYMYYNIQEISLCAIVIDSTLSISRDIYEHWVIFKEMNTPIDLFIYDARNVSLEMEPSPTFYLVVTSPTNFKR